MDCRPSRTNDPFVWLESCPEISRPLCEELRDFILSWVPDLRESVKWNMLCYSQNRLILGLGGFKKRAGVTFFRGVELPDPCGLFLGGENNTSIRNVSIPSLESFDLEAFRVLVLAAVQLDETPPPAPPPKARRPPPEIPPALARAFNSLPSAEANYSRLSSSCQREYCAWITQAKRPETLERRIKETMNALAAGLRWEKRREAPPVFQPK